MDIEIKVEAYKEVQGEDHSYSEEINCVIERDIEDEKLIKLTFGYEKPYFINMEELIKAINILKY